jgi:hypothetical protein
VPTCAAGGNHPDEVAHPVKFPSRSTNESAAQSVFLRRSDLDSKIPDSARRFHLW